MTMKRRANHAKPARPLAIFTICSNNYIGLARNFLRKAGKHHPEAELFLCLADEPCDVPGFYPGGCTLVLARDLGIAGFDNFAFRYDVMELNTALKPYMFLKLLEDDFNTVLYFDPDIEIYRHLDEVLEPLASGVSLLLTPHLTAPAEDSAFIDDIIIMKAGIYNLGFLGVSNCEEAKIIVQWWARRLAFQCISAQHQGIFVDQKFMDLVPGFAANALVLRDHTLNAAYWNLSQRTLTREKSGWAIDGKPLGFFHFSGFDCKNTQMLSCHTTAFRHDAMTSALAQLINNYATDLHAQGHGAEGLPDYAYGQFVSGTRIPKQVRELFRKWHGTWPANPFETYEDYLNAPWSGHWHRIHDGIITNLMGYWYETEPYLNAVYNLQSPDGVRAYLKWWHTNGNPDFVGNRSGAGQRAEPIHAPKMPRLVPPKRDADEPDVDVVGYLRTTLGLGEAGRAMMRAFSHSGYKTAGLTTTLNTRSPLDNDTELTGHAERAEARFRFYAVNADQLPFVSAHMHARLRPDSYRIIAPYWELPVFPDSWLHSFDEVEEIWAPTRFIQHALLAKAGKPVIHMPPPLDFDPPPPFKRSAFGLPDSGFLFFFSFDYLSFIARKNPMAAVAAFRKAFGHGKWKGKVRLVIKTLNANKASEQAQDLRRMLADEQDVVLIDKTLSRAGTLGLLDVCDAMVSLHRSEGLGLLVAEAMALGKPVICTDFGGTTDLVNEMTGWPVRYETVPVKAGEYVHHTGQYWAEADIDHAAGQMLQVVADAGMRKQRTAMAKQYIVNQFGIDAVSRRINARLKKIEGRS